MRRRWQRSHHPSHAGEVDAAAPLACSSLQLHRFDTATSLCSSLVDLLERELRQRLTATTAARPLGLATGRTMEPVYAGLVQRLRSWSVADRQRLLQVWSSFNLDEYVGLSVDHPASSAAFMRSHLFEPVGLGCERTHVPDGVLAGQDPEGAARAWEKLIRDAGGLDLQLLGLGRNGHVAFTEPGADRTSRTRLVALHEATISDNARFFSGADEVPARAITAGIATILEARKLVLMAFGAAKADAVRAVLHGPVGPEVPGSFVREHSDVEFWIDTEAAPPAELD